tara:strand:+ start:286 stop:507 length:222 start_codon:yes stop_codon:yes gene_type:complete
MTGIAKNIAKQSVKYILDSHAESQLNLAAESTREILADMIVEELQKKLKFSIQVSSPDFNDKTLTMDLERNLW